MWALSHFLNRLDRYFIVTLLLLSIIRRCSLDKPSQLVAGSTLSQPLFFAMSRISPPSYVVTYLAQNSYIGLGALVSDAEPSVNMATADIYYPYVLDDFPIRHNNLSSLDESGVFCLPLSATGLVFVYNLPTWCSPLTLTLDLALGIWNGTITNWNDPRLLELTYFLPKNLTIKPIVRTDRSGTTTLLSEFLSFTSDSFRKKNGVSALATWSGFSPSLPITSQEQVLQAVEETEGSIGFVGFSSYLSALRQQLISEGTVKMAASVVSMDNGTLANVKVSSKTIGNSIEAWYSRARSNLTTTIELKEHFPSSLMHPFNTAASLVQVFSWPYVGFVYGCLLRNSTYDEAAASLALFQDLYAFVRSQSSSSSVSELDDLGFYHLPEEVSDQSINLLQLTLRCGDFSCFSEFYPYGVLVVRLSLAVLFLLLFCGGCILLSGIFTKRSLFPTAQGINQHSIQEDRATERDPLLSLPDDQQITGPVKPNVEREEETVETNELYLDPGTVAIDNSPEGQLGKGSHGVVRRAVLTNIDGSKIPVAVKKAFIEMDHSERWKVEREARFIRDAPPHPNLIRYYGCWIEQDLMLIVIELCEGGNLTEWLTEQEKNGRLTSELKLTVLLQLAQGVRHLHASEIIHYDLKPQNLLMTSNGILKIIDFDQSKNQASFQSFDDRGSPGYAALRDPDHPEKFDSYSFGIISWEVWTRQIAYQSEKEMMLTRMELHQRIHSQGLRPDDGLIELESLRSLCVACWNATAGDRPTFQEIVSEMEAMSGNVE